MRECLSSNLSYPASNARATYYTVICDLSGCNIYFCISHKRHDFREKITENKIYIFNMSEKISHSRRIQSDVIKSAPRSSCIVTFIPLRFYLNLNFPTDFLKILKYQMS